MEEFSDLPGDEFIPASVLTTLRRNFVESLDSSLQSRFVRPLRAPELAEAKWPGNNYLDFHANVANSLAKQVYRDHGVDGPIAPAWEVIPPPAGEHLVMTTRYCLRREMGRCLKTPAGKCLKEPLTLTSPTLASPLRLAFDCKNCQMNIYNISNR